jgi:hypothetical protein
MPPDANLTSKPRSQRMLFECSPKSSLTRKLNFISSSLRRDHPDHATALSLASYHGAAAENRLDVWREPFSRNGTLCFFNVLSDEIAARMLAPACL